MRVVKKDPTFKKVMETQKELLLEIQKDLMVGIDRTGDR